MIATFWVTAITNPPLLQTQRLTASERWYTQDVPARSHLRRDSIEWPDVPDPAIRAREILMAITYEDAVAKLKEWTDNPALFNHARGVEASMRRAAHRYGAGAADE